jgi:hypothetical protein
MLRTMGASHFPSHFHPRIFFPQISWGSFPDISGLTVWFRYTLSQASPNLLIWGIAASLLRICSAGMFRFLSTILFEYAWWCAYEPLMLNRSSSFAG